MPGARETREQIRKEGFYPFTDRNDVNKIIGQSDAYRAALEKAAYGDAGLEFQQGLGALTNYLAGAGPIADSGAATGLKTKLLGQVYGQARSRINSGYADYLKQAIQAQQNFRNQQRLQREAQKAANKFNPLAAITGAASYAIPGLGAAKGVMDIAGGLSDRGSDPYATLFG